MGHRASRLEIWGGQSAGNFSSRITGDAVVLPQRNSAKKSLGDESATQGQPVPCYYNVLLWADEQMAIATNNEFIFRHFRTKINIYISINIYSKSAETIYKLCPLF